MTTRTSPISIGVISDTHGLLRPEAVIALAGSDAIIHAGDVGDPAILAELECIAPVTAVRGNVDAASWARKLPGTNVLEIGGVSVYILHNVEELDLDPATAGFAAVIFGHSHKPAIDYRKGVLFFNPGSAGPRRFRLPTTIGKLTLNNKEIKPEVIEVRLP